MSVPDAKFETDWSDLHVVRVTRCEHGRPFVMKTVIGGKNTGRRFLGCPLEDNECAFTEWLDAPWPNRAQQTLKNLWKELKATKRSEARATQALHDSLEASDVATLARVALQEEVKETKRVAQRAYTHCQEEVR